MQQEHRRVGCNCVELFDAREPLLHELMLGKATHHPHPLRRWRDRDLLLQHGHRVGERPHSVPAQFHVKVESAPNDMQVVVDQPGKHPAALQIDHFGRRPAQLHRLAFVSDRGEQPVLNSDRTCGGIGAVQCREKTAIKNHIGIHGAFPTTCSATVAALSFAAAIS